jgi:hypothetical protein
MKSLTETTGADTVPNPFFIVNIGFTAYKTAADSLSSAAAFLQIYLFS